MNGACTPVTEPVTVQGDENVVTVPASGAARYFRLEQQALSENQVPRSARTVALFMGSLTFSVGEGAAD